MVAPALWVPDRGEVIWIDCGGDMGKEMKDVHPFLVLSGALFNEKTSIVIGLPMTTSSQNEDNPFAIKFTGAKGVVSYVLTHQPKSFDWRARKADPHQMKTVPKQVFDAACDSLNQIIAIA